MVKKHTSTNSGLSDIIRDLTKKEREALISILNDKEDGDSSVDLDGEIESGSGGVNRVVVVRVVVNRVILRTYLLVEFVGNHKRTYRMC